MHSYFFNQMTYLKMPGEVQGGDYCFCYSNVECIYWLCFHFLVLNTSVWAHYDHIVVVMVLPKNEKSLLA